MKVEPGLEHRALIGDTRPRGAGNLRSSPGHTGPPFIGGMSKQCTHSCAHDHCGWWTSLPRRWHSCRTLVLSRAWKRKRSGRWKASAAVPDCVKTPTEELTLFPALTRFHRNSTSSALGRRCLYDHPAHQHSSARKPRYLLKRHEVECCHYVNIRPRASMAYDDDRSEHCWSQPLSAQGG